MHDIVIRNGTIYDGTGAAPTTGDIAIDGDRITAVGGEVGPGKKEIDAAGCAVTPGFVDIHTHYDAQVTWDPLVTPSSGHGVTTVVMGNCGVGFAPVKPEQREWLIQLMEGVEDIPGAAMSEGINWAWESFPEYLDALDAEPRAIDIAAQVPHGALRAYVMQERGARNEEATAEDVEQMAKLVEEGIRAGAVGFSTSRTLIHKGADGEYVPGTFADEAELFGIAGALERAGHGVFQMTSNHWDMPKEVVWLRKIAETTGRTVSFNLVQFDQAPELWRDLLGELDDAHEKGVPMVAQVAGRPAGVLMGWDTTAHPFALHDAFLEIAELPIDERLAALRDPERKARLINEEPKADDPLQQFIVNSFHKMYRLNRAPDYEPALSESVYEVAKATEVKPRELAYEWLMEEDGHALLYFPFFNYANGNMDLLDTMLDHPQTRLGLSDGGAHCATICDASMPTYMLTHWGRDRARGTMPIERIIAHQTSETASVYDLADRGTLTPGLRADINVIDLESLKLDPPRMAYDLPAGGKRLLQDAHGYRYTLCAGQVVRENDEPTAARPGKLIRGPQSA